MNRQWTRYIIVAFFACLLGVLAHASISRAVQGHNPERSAGPRTRAARQEDRKQGEKPQNNLLRQLWDLVEQASDLSDEEKSEAFDILEEADPILSRIKKENEQAIEILKNPPRRIAPQQPVNPAPAPTHANESPAS